MRTYLIAGSVVLTLGVGSTFALGGYDDVFEFVDFDEGHSAAHYDDDLASSNNEAIDRRRDDDGPDSEDWD